MTRKFSDVENIYNRYLAIHQYLEEQCIYHLTRTDYELHSQRVEYGDVMMNLAHQGRMVGYTLRTSIAITTNHRSPNRVDKFHTSTMITENTDMFDYSVMDVKALHLTPMMYYRNTERGGYALSGGTVFPRFMTDEMYFQYSTVHDLRFPNPDGYNDRMKFADTILSSNRLNTTAEYVLDNLTDSLLEDIHSCLDVLYENIMIGGKHVGT